MPEPAFKRPVHRQVLAILSRLDAALLERVRCYFAGGTRIALELGEYRESRGSGALAAFGQDLKLSPKGGTQVPISKWLEKRHSACGDLRPQCQKRRRQPRAALNAPEPDVPANT